MKPRMICAVLIVGLFTGLALAHDGNKHVKGTVVELGENSISVETPEKQKHTIAVDEKTKFEKSGTAATMKDLKVGDRVVIDVHETGETMHGSLVRFGKPKSAQQKPRSHSGANEKACSVCPVTVLRGSGRARPRSENRGTPDRRAI